MARRYWIGTSGWVYQHWRGVFYPSDLPSARWLAHYYERFPTVEVNFSFYRLPKEKTFENWGRVVPSGFRFAVKASRYITHIKRLKDCEEPLETFLGRARLLGDALGPVLFQLPPQFKRNVRTESALADFLALLPRDLHHVFEFRDRAWHTPDVFFLLRLHNVAFCAYHMVDEETPLEATTDFAYMRFHGSGALYGGCYTGDDLRAWAERLSSLPEDVGDLYVYFNNDAYGYAVGNALTLRGMLGDGG